MLLASGRDLSKFQLKEPIENNGNWSCGAEEAQLKLVSTVEDGTCGLQGEEEAGLSTKLSK